MLICEVGKHFRMTLDLEHLTRVKYEFYIDYWISYYMLSTT
jgi:hypothetical protein